MPSTPSDISLAVGDGARRMTYAELAAVRGTSQASAERLVRRRRWPRQVGNDGVVRVTVPLTEATNPRERVVSGLAPDSNCPAPDMSGTDPAVPPDIPRTVRPGRPPDSPGPRKRRRGAARAVGDG
jgi:hypothetical protein